jgi:His-Xaa-Ser system protein HxsD
MSTAADQPKPAGHAPIEGIPTDLARVDLDGKRAILDVEAGLYPVEALYGAAYVFIDRCYVLLDRPDPEHLRVVLTPKELGEDAEGELRRMVGELANELISAAWRHQITQENRAQIESVTMQAIAGAMGPPSLDDLEDFDFTDEAFEDPLGIAMSWEEKYAKKEPGEAGEASGGEEESA